MGKKITQCLDKYYTAIVSKVCPFLLWHPTIPSITLHLQDSIPLQESPIQELQVLGNNNNMVSSIQRSTQNSTASNTLLNIQANEPLSSYDALNNEDEAYSVTFSIKHTNGVREQCRHDISNPNLYIWDQIWLLREKNYEKEKYRAVVINVGTPEVQAHYNRTFRKKYQESNTITNASKKDDSVEQKEEVTTDTFGEEEVSFSVWRKINNIDMVNKLHYKHINQLDLALQTDTLQQAKRKIPRHYYYKLIHNTNKASGLICCKRVFGIATLSGFWGSTIYFLIDLNQYKDDYHYRAGVMALCVICSLATLEISCVCIIDPSHLLCDQYCSTTKEYKVVWKEPGPYKKKICCAKKKVFTDGKKHVLPKYTYCLGTLFNNSFCRPITQCIDKYYTALITKLCPFLLYNPVIPTVNLRLQPPKQLQARPIKELEVLGGNNSNDNSILSSV